MSQQSGMWELTAASGWEFVLRALLIYAAVLLLLRLGGKREIGQMEPFDLVLLLLVSNAVQNAMNAGDNSVTAGLILAVSLVIINYLIGLGVARSKKFGAIIEGQPQLLVRDGRVCGDALKKANLSIRDLEESMRLSGCESIDKLHYAILETNGQISFKEFKGRKSVRRHRADLTGKRRTARHHRAAASVLEAASAKDDKKSS